MNKKLKNVDKNFLDGVLHEQMSSLKNKGFNVAYICVYGSQNYGLDLYQDDYSSDIDLKAVIIPTLDNLINNTRPVSEIHKFEPRLPQSHWL